MPSMSTRPAPDTSSAVLRDGATVIVRQAVAGDRPGIEDYLLGLSEDSRRLRFGSVGVDVSAIAARAVETGPDHLTLLALRGEAAGEEVVGGAQYFRSVGDRAEVSVSVADDLQGKGLGSILIGRLAETAAHNGIGTFVALVFPENHRMIEVFRESGFAPKVRALPGTVEVEFPTMLTDDAARVFEGRADISATSAVRTFLSPGSVAVIGASRDPASIGGRLFRNLVTSGFHGVVYPVNPSARAIQTVQAYGSILEVPEPVDIAFVCVRSSLVASAARQCAEKGVRGIVVISSGFAEVQGDGAARQVELTDICRASGMRMIGPNCMGVVNTDPDVLLNGTFASSAPLAGRVGFMSQSGALGIAVMDHTTRLGLGLSSFVSVGNKADISGNDLLCYWEDDPGTDVILLYLESFGNPRRFARLARRICERKAIVAVKSGRSAAGARAASSHTGAILQASDAAVDALFRQNGVIRTETLEETLGVAGVLSNQPVPRGRRVGIITNAGGLGILCADVAEARGLSIVPFSNETVAELQSFLPAEASTGNPVDMIASADGNDYARAIRAVAGSGDVDALIVIYIPPLANAAREVSRSAAETIASLGSAVPVIVSFPPADDASNPFRDAGIPTFAYPEQAAIALAHVATLGAWRRRPRGSIPRFDDTHDDEAAALLARALERGAGWLPSADVSYLLSCCGIPVPKAVQALTSEEAGLAAAGIGGRVALKALGPLHKTDVGGVRLGLSGSAEVTAAASEMRDRLVAAHEPFEGFLVQELVEGAVEMLVGVASDPTFGPVVACGLGGTSAELLHDIAFRVPPLTDVDAAEMVRSLSGFPLLDGYRGAPRADVAGLERLILRVGNLIEAHPGVVEIDFNPVAVTPGAAIVLDARVRVESSPPRVMVGSPL
jgi:acetyl coenzyme A synthetase (ADP forming)-like protein